MLCSCYINRWYRTTGPAVTERFGSFMKGGTPNIRYFVAIYALFERLSQSFERKSSCFRRAFNKRHPDPAFVELSTKDILILLSTTNCMFPLDRKKTMFLLQKFATTRLVGIKVWWWVPRASQQNSLIHIQGVFLTPCMYHVVTATAIWNHPAGRSLSAFESSHDSCAGCLPCSASQASDN